MPAVQGYIGIIRGVSVGSFGQTLLITLKDQEGIAQDVSAFSGTKSAVALTPDKRDTISATVTFNSDGSDGIVKWTWSDGQIDRPGDWEVQVILNSGSARIKTFIAKMPVIPALTQD